MAGNVQERFFLDHGVIHDRKTGRHVAAHDFEDDWQPRLLALLNELSAELAALPEPYGWVYSFPQGMNHQFSLTRRYDMPGWIEIPLYAAQSVTVDAEAAAHEISALANAKQRSEFGGYPTPAEIEAIIRQHSPAPGMVLVPEKMTEEMEEAAVDAMIEAKEAALIKTNAIRAKLHMEPCKITELAPASWIKEFWEAALKASGGEK